MAQRVYNFENPERFVAGAVGQPGSRAFYLQAREGSVVVSVLLEKLQVTLLAERLTQLLTEVRERGANVPEEALPGDVDRAPLDEPVNEVFRVGTMAIVWDGEDESIVVEARADSVEIRTRYPDNCHRCAAVEYTITVPRGAALDPINTVNGGVSVEGVAGHIKVASVNGGVEVRKAGGDLDLSTVNGRVQGGFDRLAARRISMHSVNGAISLALPKDAGAHLEIATLHGGVRSDFALPRERDHYGPGRHVDTQIGGGGAEISLHTVNGGISLTRQ